MCRMLQVFDFLASLTNLTCTQWPGPTGVFLNTEHGNNIDWVRSNQLPWDCRGISMSPIPKIFKDNQDDTE